MPTFEEIIARTNLIVQDSLLLDSIGSFINQGVYEIAGGMQSTLGNWITPPLPKLFTIDFVNTINNLGYVDLPNTYHRALQLAVSANGREIDIENSLIDLTSTYPALDKVGNITSVVAHGGKLYYQGIPSVSEKITLHFYRKPIEMLDVDDVPDGIPEHLQMILLSNYAAWKAFSIIEDGIEENSPNTKRYYSNFLEALRTLEISIPDYTRGLILR